MSYLFLAQTSNSNGTRDKWAGSSAGQTAGTTGAVVNGALVAGVAASSFDETVLKNLGWAGAESYGDGQLLAADKSRALYDLSGATATSTDATFSAALGTTLTNTGNLLGVGTAHDDDNSANNRTLDSASGYTAHLGVQKLDLGLADVNWNDIKNVEVFIDSSDTGDGFDAVTLRSFVDARVKIGDTEGCRDASELADVLTGTAPKFVVEIVDGKRGQVDGSQSDMALDVSIDVWTNNSGWQNSFSNDGSVFGDSFTISFGSLAVAKGLSEFGVGAGKLVDATDTTLDGLGELGNQQSAYNGHLTTLFTNLGGGNDSYDATAGVAVVSNGAGGTMTVAAELQTIDYVWGGSGDDAIKAGGSNDVLYGDFGSAGGIGQVADPAALSLKLGGSGDAFANWAVAGLVKEIWQQNLGGTKVVADAGNWDGLFYLDPGYATALASGGVGVGNHTGTGGNNGANGTNPEINTGTDGFAEIPGDDDVLGFSFVTALSGATVGIGLFYESDPGSVESAIIKLTSGGAEVATYLVKGTGEVSFLSGADDFTVALTGASDSWNGTDPGNSTLDITARSTATFDGMEFTSGGTFSRDSRVSDFYITEICARVAAAEGNDTIDGGSGNDMIEGGGDRGAITVTPPATTTVHLGAEDTFENWVQDNGVVSQMYQLSVVNTPIPLVATAANFAQFANVANARNTSGLTVWDGAGRLKYDESIDNGEINTNPIQNDVIGIKLQADASGAEVGLALFYTNDLGFSNGRNLETATITLLNGGEVVASYRALADGTFETLTGGGFSVVVSGTEDNDHSLMNSGDARVAFASTGNSVFDEITIQSGGNGQLPAAADAVSDFIVTDLKLTLAANTTYDVGDDLTGGAGNDTFIWRQGDGLHLASGRRAGCGARLRGRCPRPRHAAVRQCRRFRRADRDRLRRDRRGRQRAGAVRHGRRRRGHPAGRADRTTRRGRHRLDLRPVAPERRQTFGPGRATARPAQSRGPRRGTSAIRPRAAPGTKRSARTERPGASHGTRDSNMKRRRSGPVLPPLRWACPVAGKGRVAQP
jgi:hypothetical protein